LCFKFLFFVYDTLQFFGLDYHAGPHESPHIRRNSYWPNFVDK
jgi:hypothetical protein